jgi:Tol biopolymer transport system component
MSVSGDRTHPRWVRRVVVALALAGVLGFGAYLVAVNQVVSELGEAGALAGADSGDTSLSWTPDGKHIIVERGQRDSVMLYRLNADGSHPQQVTPADAAAEDPAVSPEGKRLALVRTPDVYATDLYLADIDGTSLKALTDDELVEADPSWSPNEREIAFVRGYDLDFQSDLYVIRRDGTHLRRLTRGSDLEQTPSWSPDGKWIAYEAFPNVYVLPARGGKRRVLTRGLASPSWSPDGRRLAVVEDVRTIKVVGLRGRSVRRFVVIDRHVAENDVQTAPTDLAWSPDARRIAYTLDGSVFTLNLATGTSRRLT